MEAIRVHVTTLFGGAVLMWASGVGVAVALSLLLFGPGDRGVDVGGLVGVGALSRRPGSLNWSPLRIPIAGRGALLSWRASVGDGPRRGETGDGMQGEGDAKSQLAASGTNMGVGAAAGPILGRRRPAERRRGAVERKSGSAAAASSLTASARAILGGPLVWVTRVDTTGRKYRCLVPVARWEARAMASVDWQLRVAGLASGGEVGWPLRPSDWLDARFCTVVDAAAKKRGRQAGDRSGSSKSGSNKRSALLPGSRDVNDEERAATAAERPLPRERVMQAL